MKKNRIILLLVALFLTTTATANDDVWASPYDSRIETAVVGDEPSKQELLQYLQKKRERAEARLSLVDDEIRCVEDARQGDGSIWSCYEVAQQQRQRLKRKYQALNPYPKRQRQRASGMPNFGNMGMGRMPMPW